MLWRLYKPTKKFMKIKKWSLQWTQFMQLKKPEKKFRTSIGFKLNPWPRDTGVMLYQLSYEATDVGSRSIVGSYVPVKEMSVNDIWNKSYMNCRKWNENEEMIVTVNTIYGIAYKLKEPWKKNSGLQWWLHSSVGRALHRYRKVMGSNPVEVRNFFSGFFTQLHKLHSLKYVYWLWPIRSITRV